MSTFTIDELPIPATLDGPDAADFIESTSVRNEVEKFEYGSDEMFFPADEALPGYLDSEYQPRRLFVARMQGRIVARAVYECISGESTVAWLDVRVLPDRRGRGIGTALTEMLENLAQLEGRSRLITYAVSADAPGERLTAPTGFGSLPLAKPEVQFLLKRGYRLEQVERGSRLALPVPESLLKQQFESAAAAAGATYAAHQWVGPIPECRLSDMADLFTNMSIEEPSAGLDEPPSNWTVQRLLDTQELESRSSQTAVTTVIEHLSSHRLVGYSILGVPGDLGRPVSQQDTLVMPGHRGHRLGMLLKTANIKQLQLRHPGHPAIMTFNAEENRHMLSVNEAIGFVPIGYEGAWKKILT